MISFWDALFIVAAEGSGAKKFHTEDLQAGQELLGVRIVTPFREPTA
jgi:predicted nucleic acid-binding protein